MEIRLRCFLVSVVLLLGVNAEILPHTVINTVDGIPIGGGETPISTRTIYKMYMSPTTLAELNANVPNPNPLYPDALDGTLIVEGNGLGLLVNGDVVLVPYPSYRPGIDHPNTVCGAVPGNVPLNLLNAAPFSQTRRVYNLSPFLPPVQAGILTTPTLHVEQGWWICVRNRANHVLNGAVTEWVMTQLMVNVYLPCDADANAASLTHSDAFVRPNPGPRVDFGTHCAQQAVQVAHALLGETNELDPRYMERTRRTVCCGWRDAVNVVGQPTLIKRFGMCINPGYQRCCSSQTDARRSVAPPNTGLAVAGGGLGYPYNFHREQCCYGGDFPTTAGSTAAGTRTSPNPAYVRFLDQSCPCIRNRETEFCPRLDAGQGQQLCCTQTIFPELIPTGTLSNRNNGTCYDPIVQKCCQNGAVYDPGVAQCCTVTGLQSPDVPCPCNNNNHCGRNQRCCVRDHPPIFTDQVASCSAYSNFPQILTPGLNVDPSSQNCAGICIDTRFQICCNGIACVDRFETCCNSTCCNRFTSDCNMGRLEASVSPFNPNNFRIPYEVCTERESLNLPRAIIAYYFPLILLIATYLGLAFSLFFAKRQNALSPLSGYEKGMYVIALLLILFSWPMYFAPVWRYGIVTIWIAFFSIVAALSGIRVLVLVAAIAQFIGFIYLIDFWYGSDLFTLASVRPGATNGVGSNGNILSVIKMWRTPLGNTPIGQQCTSWYDFFLRDNLTEDWLRFDNPHKTTFGFCAREWVATLMVLCLFNIVLLAVLFFVTVITHLKNVLVKKVIMASGEPILAGLQ